MVAGTMTAKLTIDIWSDVMCPWCVIGYKNLEKALAELDGEIEAEVRWMPFELNPNMSAQGEEQDAHIMKKYGRPPEQMAQVRENIRNLAGQAGFSMEWQGEGEAPPPMMWNTRTAHVLLRWALEAKGAEAQTRLKLALFRAHFQQRRNVSDPQVLADIALAEGFDRDAALAAMKDDRLAGVVAWEEDRGHEMNITGVPAMIVNDRLMIPGAQQPETYVSALRQAVAKGL
jgi:predicted DsbA family dithiol-disulfide isomerase